MILHPPQQFLPLWLVILLLNTGSAQTAIIDVDPNCSLDDAITAANTDQAVGGCLAGNGVDVINITQPNQTIQVNMGLYNSELQSGIVAAFPAIKSDLTIEGNGVHIQADASVNKFRVLEMIGALGERLILRNITISGADDGLGTGSALFTAGGRLTIENSHFFENHGAILMIETLDILIDRIKVENNWMHENGNFSPGIEAFSISMVLKNSSIVNNHVIFSDSGFAMSKSHAPGGLGMTAIGTGFIDIINTTISGNRSITGGGLMIREDTLSSTLSGNLIFVNVNNSTVANNQALFGGGVVVFDANSTFSLNQTLIVGNTSEQIEGRELWVEDGANLTMDGFNLIQQQTNNSGLVDVLGNSDVISSQNKAELILPLTEANGMPVHLLPANSDALDAGTTDCQVTTDQLNQLRPVDGNGDGSANCDIGAIEYQDFIFNADFE